MRKYILLLSLLPLFCFGQTDNNDKTITVIGISEMEIEPDLITISMTAKETENVKKESDLVTAEKKLLNFITSLGIDKEDFFIDRFYARELSTLTGTTKFKQSKTYKLVIPKASLLDTIVAKCFEAGMENVFVTKVDHSKMDSLRNDLLAQALYSAKNKAEIIANNIGSPLGKVISVNESYQLVGNQQNWYDNGVFALNEIALTGYTSGISRSTRVGSSITFEKIHLSKTIIVKFEIN